MRKRGWIGNVVRGDTFEESAFDCQPEDEKGGNHGVSIASRQQHGSGGEKELCLPTSSHHVD